MSYSVNLYDLATGKTVYVEKHTEGGTICAGGDGKARMSITYNYSWFYYKFLHAEGLYHLNGKKASDVDGLLRKAIDVLGTRTHADYWADTPGNAGKALEILMKWGEQYPDAFWSVR